MTEPSTAAGSGAASEETLGAKVQSGAQVAGPKENREALEVGASTGFYFVEARRSWLRRDEHPSIAGLEFELFLEGHPEVVLFRGVTPESGRLAVNLERARDGHPIVAANLRGRVISQGYQRLIGRVSSHGPEGDGKLVRLTAMPGVTVTGRVINRRGKQARASVSGMSWVTDPGPRRLEKHGRVEDLGEGRFALYLPEAPTDFIVADAVRGGLAVYRVEKPEALDPEEPITLTLESGGAVRGKLCDEIGQPVVGRRLLVCRAELDSADGSFPPCEPAASQSLIRGGGMPWRQVITNQRGEFRAGGLRRGKYVIRAGLESRRKHPVLLTPEPVFADGKSLLLSLTRTCLVVRLLDAQGSPWAGDAVVVDRPGDSLGPTSWPARPHLRVTPSTTGPGGPFESGTVVSHAPGPSNEILYELPRGGEFWVTAYGGPFNGTPQHVVVDPDGGRQELEVRAGVPVELAGLRVNLSWDAGSASNGKPSIDLYVEDQRTGVIVQSLDPYFGQTPFLFEVPPGLYRVIAQGAPSVDTYHGVLMSPRELGRAEAAVELVAGSTREVDLALRVGGRLEVTVTGTSLPEDKEQVIASHPNWPNASEDGYLSWTARSVELTLERPGRRPETLYHQDSILNLGGARLEKHWPMGETHTSEILPEGQYELVARTAGGRVARMSVEITGGVTAPVKIELGDSSAE